jgi:ribosomal protein L6P/L9E
MSRIGKAPITIAKGVEVTFASGVLTVKGPKGELKQDIDSLKLLTERSRFLARATTETLALSTVCTAH